MPSLVEGECPLTATQLELVELLADGLTPKQIAEGRGRARSTVRMQLMDAYRRMAVAGSDQLVIECVRNGWVVINGMPDPTLLRLERIERVLLKIASRVEDRRLSRPLSPALASYLETFDAYLRSGGDLAAVLEGSAAAGLRDRMLDALRVITSEAKAP